MNFQLYKKKYNIHEEENDFLKAIASNVFKFNLVQNGVSSVDCNYKDYPKNYKSIITDIVVNDEKLKKKFAISTKNILCKNLKNFHGIPKILINNIFEYTYELSNNFLEKVRVYSYFNVIDDINKIISENKFDLIWYNPGEIDYSWACDTIKNCNLLIDKIYLEI